MNRSLLFSIFLSLLVAWNACRKDDLPELSFIEVFTEAIGTESLDTIEISGQIQGLLNSDTDVTKVIKYGHIYSSNPDNLEPKYKDHATTFLINLKKNTEEIIKNGLFTSKVPVDSLDGTDIVKKYYYRAYAIYQRNIPTNPEPDTILADLPVNNDTYTFSKPSFSIIIDSTIINDRLFFQFGGEIRDISTDIEEYGHVWSTNKEFLNKLQDINECDNCSCEVSKFGTIIAGINDKNGKKEFLSNVKNLDAGTEYFVKTYAKANNDYKFSTNTVNFKVTENFWKKRTDTLSRTGAVSFELDGIGYVGLGMDENGHLQNDFWSYNPKEDNWKKVMKMDFPEGEGRAFAVSFVLNNQVFIGTGIGENGSKSDNFLTYNGSEWDSIGVGWETAFENKIISDDGIKSQSQARHSAYSFVLNKGTDNETAYFGGGTSASLQDVADNNIPDNRIFNDLWMYDIENDTFSRIFPSPHYTALLYHDNLIYTPCCIKDMDTLISSTFDCSIINLNLPPQDMLECMKLNDTTFGIPMTSDSNLPSLPSSNLTINNNFYVKKTGATAFTISNKGYIMFGKSSDKLVDSPSYLVFDGENFTIENYPNSPPNSNRMYALNFVIDNKAFIGGGESSNILGDFWRFNDNPTGFTRIQSCGLDGISRGVAFSLENDNCSPSDNSTARMRGYIGIGQTRSTITKEFFTYIPETN